eukprot:CAMPEP_0197237506 /NCGR_PEP_ID=MMETSP1429-20130617/4316_1 /TAXON_ID=49237 /ORGANISM="Chaetoceros  sp., Strain UNC1202" /LENGTH=295 /DNA_ID=CAMNT_0042696521 /DNA_START=10 /DNA_END=897 /DNA_ORIENTATION=-
MTMNHTTSPMKSILAKRIEEISRCATDTSRDMPLMYHTTAQDIELKRYKMLLALQAKYSPHLPTKMTDATYLSVGSLPTKKRAIVEAQDTLPAEPNKRLRCSSPSSHSSSPKLPPGTVGLATYDIHDVLSGRGGGTNTHPGNRCFRVLIDENREKYLRARKNDKPDISRSIVNAIRVKNGRFLKKDEDSGLWFEIGDDQAREKTSQALRQKAPDFRRQMEVQDRQVIQSVMVPTSPSLYFDDHSQTPLVPTMPQLPQQHPSLLAHFLTLRERQLRLQEQMLLVQEMKESLRMRRI